MIEDKYRFIITRKEHIVYYGYFHNDTPVELYLEEEDSSGLLGNIYAARVERVLPDMGGAFLELDGENKCYYPLSKNGQKPVWLSVQRKNDLKTGNVLSVGDIVLVQVAKDAVKSKLPVADSNISLPGKYFVLTLSDKRAGISRKIQDPEERKRLEEIVSKADLNQESMVGLRPFGIIIRTNACGVEEDVLMEELTRLSADYQELMRKASIAFGRTLLKKSPPYYVTYPRDIPEKELTEIVTDQEDIYKSLISFYHSKTESGAFREKIHFQDEAILSKLRFYQDEYPLMKLYRLETHYSQALSKTVWLPSGGSIVIEPTEAMVVIDVNTAGVTKKKQKEEDLFYQINREAASEIGRQLRLRNLSGIIVIDFINMRHGKHRVKLLNYLKQICEKDRIRTHVMDITALNLVEMTRQKVRKPLHEQAALIKH